MRASSLILTLFAFLTAFPVPAQTQTAIRSNAGFNGSALPRTDDGSSPSVPIGWTLNFFGQQRANVFVNNNGNITFASALSEYTPFGLSGVSREIIAVFFADVDTRNAASSVVTYGRDTVNGRAAFGVNYLNVGYYNNKADKTNRFQLVLIERNDTGAGNFDIEFNYDRIVWETGDASGGTNGLGGTSAAVGWSNGVAGSANRSFQLTGSLTPGSFLDGSSGALRNRSIGNDIPGRLLFQVRSGVIVTVSVAPVTATLSGGQSRQFTAEVAGIANQAVTWSITPQVGSISQTGLYSAPSIITSQQSVSVIATSLADPTRSGTATVTLQSGCTYSFNQPSVSFDSNGGTGSVNILAGPGCTWSAVSNNAFVMITGAATGSGNGVINYSVAANTGGISRSANINAGGQTYVVTQAGRGCFAGISPTVANVPSASTMGTVQLALSSPDCPWSASSNVQWATLTPPAGIGPASINYMVSANGASVGRSGTLNIAGILFTLNQAGTDCSRVALSDGEQAFPAEGGSGSVIVAVPAGCAFTATSSQSFVTITSGGTGSQTANLQFTVQPNTSSAARAAVISVAGETLTITQSGNVTPTITCTVPAVTPPNVRSTGRTELIAPLDVVCSGRTGGNVFAADIVLRLNSPVTNRITSAATDTTDAFLTVRGGGIVFGRADGPNALRFRRVPLSTGEPTVQRRFTISNVRADVSALGTASGSAGISVLGRVTVQAPLRVAAVDAVRTVALSKASISAVRGTQRNGELSTQRIVPVIVQEGFAGAFKSRTGEAGPGTADTATRLFVRISNIPAGVSVFAAVQSENSRARLYSADASGAGGTPLTGSSRAGGTYAQLTPVANAATATYEVTAVDDLSIESLSLLCLVENATQTQIDQLRLEVMFAPVSDIGIASPSAPVPRFTDTGRAPPRVNLRVISRVQTGNRPVAQRSPVGLGNTATFSYTIVNDSDQRADNVVVRNNLPENLTNPSCSSPQGTCSVQEGSVRVTIPSIQPGAQATVNVNAALSGLPNCPNCVGNGSVLQNNVSVSADQADPELENNTSETVLDVVAPCTFNVSRNLVTAPPAGANVTVDVATGPACEWSVINPVNGTQILPPGPYRGPLTVTVALPANTAPSPRSGIITMAGSSLQVFQMAQGCNVTLSATNTALTPQAANFSATVTAPAGCAWQALASPDWLRINGATTGTGNGTLPVTAQDNPSAIVRQGYVEAGGSQLQVIQQPFGVSNAGCNYSLSATALSFSGAGSSSVVQVTTQANCAWTASSNVSWASVTSGISGTGTEFVSITAQANPGAARVGTLTIAGQTVNISQGTASGSGLRFVPLEPCRVMETRAEYNFQGRTGAFGPPFMTAQQTRTLNMSSSNVCQIPATAQAYVLNVTLVPRGGVDFVTIWPGGEPRPNVWTIRSPDGQIVANSAIIRSGGGAIQVYSSNDADILIDITGYMTENAQTSNLVYYPLTPCRVIETRAEYRQPAGPFGPPSLVGMQPRRFRFPATPYCQVPNGAAAYSITITAVPPGPLQFLTAWPGGGAQPNVSQINSPAGRVLANTVIVPTSSDGSIDVFAFDNTDFIVDINGYFAPDDGANGLFYFPVTQCRVSDSRNVAGPFGGPIFEPRTSRVVPMPLSACSLPANARGYAVGVTAIPNGNPMPFITVWPSGQPFPNASILNAFQGQIVTNSAIIPAGAAGGLDVYAFERTHIVVEVSGYFGR
ncbi:MAG: DUF11 domain-containing protein [Bryobacterales bacterium]|nr:DUF11 domain-containing protein [Bryobacterales bacterium]